MRRCCGERRSLRWRSPSAGVGAGGADCAGQRLRDVPRVGELSVGVRAPGSGIHLHARVRRAARLDQGRGRRPCRAENAGRDLRRDRRGGPVRGRVSAAGRLGFAACRPRRRAAGVVSARARTPSRPALLCALWPAGLAMSSVVGTDMPAAALLALALALLVTLGPRRPWRGGGWRSARRWGCAPGCARWRCRCRRWPSATGWRGGRRSTARRLLTAVGVATTLVVLLPWGIRHVRQSGSLYFTDDHGGITALIGANPNSEGTYTRALNRMFQDVTGRSVLDEPHHDTDRAAYAIAREWFRFEPGYALGLATLKADRLFDPEHRLLYWSIFRPGVLVGRPAAWFAARRDAHRTRLADALRRRGGGARARRCRRRRRAPAVGAARAGSVPARAGRDLHRLLRRAALPPADRAARVSVRRVRARGDRRRRARRRVSFARRPRSGGEGARAGAACSSSSGASAWPATLEAGTGLRARHRWAVSEVELDGRRRLLLWAPAPPLAPQSPLAGSPEGVHVRVDGGGRPTPLRLRLGGGPLPAGRYAASFPAGSPGGCPLRPRGQGGGGRGRRARRVRRRNRSSGWTAETVRRNCWFGAGIRLDRRCEDRDFALM